MPHKLILVLIALASASGLTLLLLISTQHPPAQPSSRSPPLTIERVQALSTMVTTRVTIRSEQTEVYDGYLGAMTVTWQGDGSVLLGPNLHTAQITRRNDSGRTATIRLPQPVVLEQTLDLSTSRITTSLEGLWQVSPDQHLLAIGQRRLLQHAQTTLVYGVAPEHYAAARVAAETTLQQFGRSLGWTIRVQWQDRPGRRSLDRERRPGGLFV